MAKPPATDRPHFRMYNDVQDSHAWHALTHTEQAMYIALRRQLMSFNNGDIEASAKKLKDDDFTSTSTIAKGLRAMLTVGLIAKTRQGLMTHGGKSCSLYRFTDRDCRDIPKKEVHAVKATNEWKAWKSRAEARSAVADAHAAALNPNHPNAKKTASNSKCEPSPQNASKVRQSNRIASPIESEGQFSDSPIEHSQDLPIRLANDVVGYEIGRKPPSLLDIALARRAALAA